MQNCTRNTYIFQRKNSACKEYDLSNIYVHQSQLRSAEKTRKKQIFHLPFDAMFLNVERWKDERATYVTVTRDITTRDCFVKFFKIAQNVINTVD
jgi:hypothetical protein